MSLRDSGYAPVVYQLRRRGNLSAPHCDDINLSSHCCPRSRLKIWSRETGSDVPSRVSTLISKHSKNLVLTQAIRPASRDDSNNSASRHRVSPRFYQFTQLRADGVHQREFPDTEAVPVTSAPVSCILPGAFFARPSLPTATNGTVETSLDQSTRPSLLLQPLMVQWRRLWTNQRAPLSSSSH